MTTALDEAERRFPNDDYYEERGRVAPEVGSKRDAFEDGYDFALESVAPLIEAARAYRDAHKTASTTIDRPDAAEYVNGVLQALWRAETALAEAARTLEGHVEEGSQ
jgi:hypothetical protein